MNKSQHRRALVVAAACVAALLCGGCTRQEPAQQAGPTTAKASVGNTIDDTVVTTKVKAALLQDPDVRGVDIKVETYKGTVQLGGFAQDQSQVDRAIAIARSIQGVANVENAMSLKQGTASVGNKVDDGIVTTKIKSALISDPSVKAFDIAVTTRKGEVQLSGFVDSQAQIDHAIEVARKVEGVQGVESKLSIKK
jgi:hyperosmotically inducible periplasmic protein